MVARRSAEALVERVGALEARVGNVEAETKVQTAMLETVRANSDTLVKQALDAATERGRRAALEDERKHRQTDAETRLKTWQRYAIPVGVVIAILSFLFAHGVKP